MTFPVSSRISSAICCSRARQTCWNRRSTANRRSRPARVHAGSAPRAAAIASPTCAITGRPDHTNSSGCAGFRERIPPSAAIASVGSSRTFQWPPTRSAAPRRSEGCVTLAFTRRSDVCGSPSWERPPPPCRQAAKDGVLASGRPRSPRRCEAASSMIWRCESARRVPPRTGSPSP